MTDDVSGLRPRMRVEGDVRAVYIAVNPDKLGRWAAAEVE